MNLPQWELQDVLQFAKTEMKQSETDTAQIIVNNYQIQEENGQNYFEIYQSIFNIDDEMTTD